jgi:hypothetical protein
MMQGDEYLIPIAELFYDDAGPHVLARPTPVGGFPTPTPAGAAPRHTPAGENPRHTPAGETPRHTPTGETPRHTPARGRELQDLLGTSIIQLGGVAGGTRRTPTPAPPPVAIESLLYRGRAALERALEIRSATLGGAALSPETIEELLDLIALAAEE